LDGPVFWCMHTCESQAGECEYLGLDCYLHGRIQNRYTGKLIPTWFSKQSIESEIVGLHTDGRTDRRD
jgi:hypothetical protein